MNPRMVVAALRALADAVEAAPDVPVVVPGQDELVDAKNSRLGVKLFRRLVREGDLVGARVGRRLMVRRSELDRWLATQAIKPRQRPEPEVAEVTEPDHIDLLVQRALSAGRLRVVRGAK